MSGGSCFLRYSKVSQHPACLDPARKTIWYSFSNLFMHIKILMMIVDITKSIFNFWLNIPLVQVMFALKKSMTNWVI